MLKFIRGIIFTGLAVLLAFLIISLLSGGEKFRWLGKEAQKQSEVIGYKADRIREKGEEILKILRQTKGKMTKETGKKDEAPH
jgi:hypothetical protein